MTAMDDLVAFLRARLVEDEREANAAQERHGNYHLTTWTPTRVLTEIETNRREVEMLAAVLASAALPEHVRDGRDPDEAEADEGLAALAGQVLRLRALPFADHPDYDESWRP